MRYPVAIETGDAKHAFGVVVPDLPGCFSAGDTLDDALTNSREAILLHLEGLMDDGQPFPAPSPIELLRKKRSYRGWTWAVVEIDASELGDRAAGINITLPQRILRAIDGHALSATCNVSITITRNRIREIRNRSTKRVSSCINMRHHTFKWIFDLSCQRFQEV